MDFIWIFQDSFESFSTTCHIDYHGLQMEKHKQIYVNFELLI